MIGDVPRPRPPYLQLEVTRHGARVWYFRRPGERRIRIRGEYGSAEFIAAYEEALAGRVLVHQKQLKEAGGSLARLIARYRGAAEWASLSEATRRQRDNIFTRIIVENGSKAAAKLRREHIVAGRDRRISTPAAANNFLKTLRGLCRWAADNGLIEADPTIGEGYAVKGQRIPCLERRRDRGLRGALADRHARAAGFRNLALHGVAPRRRRETRPTAY
ncbi:MAG: int [Methylocystaceae bacterium]|nr:MAG: int [Methylocystaceae bacterium]